MNKFIGKQYDLHFSQVMDYTNSGAWRVSEPLPTARTSLRGVSIGQDFYVTGGEDLEDWVQDEILSWDPASETWSVAGHLLKKRRNHGVAEVSLDEFTDYCVSYSSKPPLISTSLQALVVLCLFGTLLDIAM